MKKLFAPAAALAAVLALASATPSSAPVSQSAPASATVPAASAAAPVVPAVPPPPAVTEPAEPLVSLDDIKDLPAVGGDVSKVINNWKALGVIAGLIALLNLLMNLLRIGFVDRLFRRANITWIKPLLAAGLGAILGGLLAYQAGANIPNAIIAGLMAGLSAIGLHGVGSLRRADKRIE